MPRRKMAGFYEDWGVKGQLVGADYVNEPFGRGPIATITYDKDWLYIKTDQYLGEVQLNIEALPQFRRALSRIIKRLKPKATATKKKVEKGRKKAKLSGKRSSGRRGKT